MLDPLTALSVAGNVLQFIDFAGKVISANYELQRGKRRTLGVNESLENIALIMIKFTKKLESLDETTEQISDDDKALVDLCRPCRSIANDTTKLETLKVQGDHKPWKLCPRL